MAKYSYEFKLQVVQAYLDGEGGYRYLSKKYGVPSKRDIEKWVFAYKAFGKDGLMRSRKNESYSFEFKLHVVELYLTTEVSYQELALSVGINNPPLIARWVNDHRIAGPDALKVKSKGRQKKLNKAKDNSPLLNDKQNSDLEYLKQPEDENLKLRIENAYLKELRRLRLEEEALLKKQRLSSTAREEPTNTKIFSPLQFRQLR